jgi:hypothetical protein
VPFAAHERSIDEERPMRDVLLAATMVVGALMMTVTVAGVLQHQATARVAHDDATWEPPPALASPWQPPRGAK